MSKNKNKTKKSKKAKKATKKIKWFSWLEKLKFFMDLIRLSNYFAIKSKIFMCPL